MRYSFLNRSQAVVVLALLLTVAAAGFSQTQTPSAYGRSQNELSPKVTGVSGKLEVGQEIVFNVAHLSEWAQGHDSRKLVPFINGRSLNGLYPEQVDLSQNQLRFHLLRTPATKRVWNDLFREPVLSRPVTLSLGLEDQKVFDSAFDDAHQIPLTIIPKRWGTVSLILIVLTLVVFIYLAKTTNLIRVPGPTVRPGNYRPYSLGRAQMTFWFVLIFVCYVSLWLVTGDYYTIGRSQFALAVISSFTAVGSHLVTGQPTDNDALLTSNGFFADLLSDVNGVRLHRFQLCAWTILLGVIFANSVYDELVMPEFGNTLLALAGISAATHVAFTHLEQERSTSSMDTRNA